MNFIETVANALADDYTIEGARGISGASTPTASSGYGSENEKSDGLSMTSTDKADGSVGESTNDYYPGSFEGPEKTMEVVFRIGVGAENGLRSLTREQLDHLCTLAKCTILSSISNSHMDAYVLSESSLFVYKHRYIMKTCGTTTLLRCLSTLLKYADNLGMELTWVGYSRKNLLFPDAQHFPHSNFGEEIKYMNSHAKLQDRLRGAGHILGPITGDHWFVYVADHPLVSSSIPLTPAELVPSTERTINMMMFDMAPDVASIFFKKNTETGKEMTQKSGIAALCPGATIDETAFTPCGYSMNAILHDAYSTIHITPEPECSYVSFETNACLRNYNPMVRNVLKTFRPQRFVLTMFGDESAINSMPELPSDPRRINLPAWGQYVRTSCSSTKVEAELCCIMAVYSLEVASLRGSRASSSDLVLTQKNLAEIPARGQSVHKASAPLVMRERGYSLG